MAFAIKPPPKPASSKLGRNLYSIGTLIMGDCLPYDIRTILGAVYTLVYVIAGFGAILAWIKGSESAPLVTELAFSFAGMIPPIVLAFFAEPS